MLGCHKTLRFVRQNSATRLDLALGDLVNELLVVTGGLGGGHGEARDCSKKIMRWGVGGVRDDALGDGLADGVDLSHFATSGNLWCERVRREEGGTQNGRRKREV